MCVCVYIRVFGSKSIENDEIDENCRADISFCALEKEDVVC